MKDKQNYYRFFIEKHPNSNCEDWLNKDILLKTFYIMRMGKF